jgi:hypothetical protein
MVNHVKSYISQLLNSTENPEHSMRLRGQVHELFKEIDKLDPRDFDPDAQEQFMSVRADVSNIAKYGESQERKQQILTSLSLILDRHRGEGSHRVTRSFAFISDPHLREIIERDYSELSRILFPAGAWKSTVIMAGSIIEAILYDRLTADASMRKIAMDSYKAPKERGGATKDIMEGEWKLHALIEVATDIAVLPADRAETFDRVLRDYRNFVHPKAEIRTGHPCGDAEAMMAKGALDAICDHLTRRKS